jgi:FkbM family methyltransferase
MPTAAQLGFDNLDTFKAVERPFGTYRPGQWVGALIEASRRLGASALEKRAGAALRWLAWSTPQTRVDLRVLGSAMRLRPVDNATEKILTFTPQLFDPTELAAIAEHLCPGMVFVDVGANVGAYTLFAAHAAAETCKLIAVEPHPVALERLRYNLAANGYDNVLVEPVAVADRCGTVSLNIVASNLGQTSVVENSVVENAVRGQRGSVHNIPSTTLLAICEKHQLGRLDVLKIDIEGYEILVLQQFFATAGENLWPRLLIMEINAGLTQSGLLDDLCAKGYVFEHTKQRNIICRRP